MTGFSEHRFRSHYRQMEIRWLIRIVHAEIVAAVCSNTQRQPGKDTASNSRWDPHDDA